MSGRGARARRIGLMATLGAACAAAPAPRPAPPTRPRAVEPPMRVEAVKQQLQVTPWELVFSGVRGAAPSDPLFVNVRNGGAGPQEIARLAITGEQAASFALGAEPRVPLALAPAAHANLSVAFAAPGDAAPGLHRATLRVFTQPEDDVGIPIDLVALVAESDSAEPPLELVVRALGFGLNVGAPAAALAGSAAPLGDERPAPRFVRARPTPIATYPAARYSAAGPVTFGYYVEERGGPVLYQLGVMASAQAQALNPAVEGEAKTSFDPGDRPFGLFVKVGQTTLFTDDHLHAPPRHAARAYPLRTSAGQRVPDAHVVAFDEGLDGDYQDLVFVIYNARPAL